MTQLIKVFAAKPDDLSLMPRTHVVGVNDSYKLCSDLHTCTHMLYAPAHTHTIDVI